MANVGDMGSLFGIEGLKDDLKEAAILGASAAGSIVIGSLALKNLPWVKDQSAKVQGGIAIGLGVAGGIAVGRYVNRGAGAGVAAGLIGVGIVKLLGEFSPSLKVLSGYGVDGFAGLGRGDDAYFQGLGAGNDEASLLLGVNEHQAQPLLGVDERPAGQVIGNIDDDDTVSVREGAEREDFNGISDVREAGVGSFLQ